MIKIEGDLEHTCFLDSVEHFPLIIDGRINAVKFLDAATDLITVVDRLGKLFAPVKYDMQGNIEKIKKHFKIDENSCLLELMHIEINTGKPYGTEGVLWLNRAILFFELLFQEIIICLATNNFNADMKKIYYICYEKSVKKYHNWVTQRLFSLITKMTPSLPQIMKFFDMECDTEGVEESLTNFNIRIHLIRCKLDDFFKEQNVYDKYTLL